jgi:hypothetical protein
MAGARESGDSRRFQSPPSGRETLALLLEPRFRADAPGLRRALDACNPFDSSG